MPDQNDLETILHKLVESGVSSHADCNGRVTVTLPREGRNDLELEANNPQTPNCLKAVLLQAGLTVQTCTLKETIAILSGRALLDSDCDPSLEILDRSLLENPVVEPVLRYVEQDCEHRFEGRTEDLLNRLNRIQGDNSHPRWPMTTAVLTRRLQQAIPSLSSLGIRVCAGEHRQDGSYTTIWMEDSADGPDANDENDANATPDSEVRG